MEKIPRHSRKWSLMLLAASLSLLVLSGCVYLRLLEVKRNLKDFDNYFEIQGDKDWIVLCKMPVMLSKDMSYMIGAQPLKVENEGNIARWHYEFEGIRPKGDNEQHPMDHLSLDMEMTDGKMSKFIVPPSFTQLFSHQVLTELLRAAPNAEVLELRKTLRARVHLSPAADAELPSKEKTLSLLGKPLETKSEGELETLVYRYRIQGDGNVPIVALMTFSSDGLLRRTIVHWDTSSADAEFIRPSSH